MSKLMIDDPLLAHLLLFSMPLYETFPSIGHVRLKHHGILFTMKGTVIRSGAIKKYEREKTYMCGKCIHIQSLVKAHICHDYQEIEIEDSMHIAGVGVIRRAILVILKDDLVDVVKAGDDVIVTRILQQNGLLI